MILTQPTKTRVANSPQVHREDTTDEDVTYEELSASIGRLTTSSAYDDNRIMDNIMAAAEQIGEEVASMSAEELLKTNVARYVESEMVERMNQLSEAFIISL